MAVKPIVLEKFLELSVDHPVLDVRSPAEYAHAHIPGAYSLPLFNDEERKVVGTAYKQESREQAIKIGLDYFGPKMRRMVEVAEGILSQRGRSTSTPNPQTSNILLVHCWRGGMRSAGVAWMLDLYGFEVYTLVGGYKSFRHFVVETFTRQWSMKVLGGYTGSGKTAILEKIERLGESVIDLEKLAFHKGSAFGHLGQPEQPSQEMFENKLAVELSKLSGTGGGEKSAIPQPFWVEDESWRIGNILVPQPFYKQMRSAPCYFLDIPFSERLQYIIKDYGKADRENLISAVLRIQKRLGGLETKTAINCLVENDIEGAFSILLKYYDKWYLKGLYSREPGCPPVVNVPANSVDPVRNSQLLLNTMN